MTFKCELCGDISKPREKQHKVVSAVRYCNYNNGEKITAGFEPLKELVLCETCNTEVSEENIT